MEGLADGSTMKPCGHNTPGLRLPHSRFAGNSEPSFVFPTVIATRQSGTAASSNSSSSGGGRAPPPVAGKPGHLASKRGIEDLDFFIGDEAVANSK